MVNNERFYIKESILKDRSVIQDREHKYSFPILQDTMNFMFNRALNELNNACDFLAIESESLEDAATRYAELYHKSLKENEQFKDKVYSVIDKKINEFEDDYNRAVKAGMPSMSVYDEIELLEELKKELEE